LQLYREQILQATRKTNAKKMVLCIFLAPEQRIRSSDVSAVDMYSLT